MAPQGAFLSRAGIESLEAELAAAGKPKLVEADLPDPESKEWDYELEKGDWSYELRLGESYGGGSRKHTKEDGELVTIEPGEFALLLTHEKVNIPTDVVAFISMRLRHKLKGLVNVSGFHVNPGYSGRLLFSVYNAAPRPVTIRHGDPMFMIVFGRLDQPVLQPRHTTKIDTITPDHVDLVHGPGVSLVSLGERVEKLEGQLKFWRGLTIAVITGLIVAILRSGITSPGGG